MLDHAIGPNVIRGLIDGMSAFLERHADRGWRSLEDFRGYRRDSVVAHARIARPGGAAPGEAQARAAADEGALPVGR